MNASSAALSINTASNVLREHFLDVRKMTMRITEHLSAEDQMLQSMPEASPTKWHLAHTTWFFETFLLVPRLAGYRTFDERFTYLFNSYYKQLGGHPYRGSRGLMSRPRLDEVRAYRAHVDQAMLQLIESADEKFQDLIELGLNHEQQHQELIVTDVKHAFWCSPVRPERITAARGSEATAPLRWTSIDGGIYSIGHEGNGFAFDNESPRHDALLQPFQIASRLVTNAEYLEFMQDGGYRRPELWLSDGWDAVGAQGWNAPFYWEKSEDGSWRQFTLNGMKRPGLKEVDPAEPVCHVSFYEADAYARWSGARLPREEEWEVAAERSPAKGSFLEDNEYHPQRARNEQTAQIFGDAWEWTASAYLGYPGFKTADGAVGEYNGKFMCNQFVLRGGSCATPESHIRASYRNFFPPQTRWQFSGIRLAK